MRNTIVLLFFCCNLFGQNYKSSDCNFNITYKVKDSVSVHLIFETYGKKDTCIGHLDIYSFPYTNHQKLKVEDLISFLDSRFKKLEDSLNFQLKGLRCPSPLYYADLYASFYEVFSKSEKWKKFHESYSKYTEKYKSQFRVDYKLIENIILESNLYDAYFKVFQKEGYKVKGIMIEKVNLIPIELVEYRIKNWNDIRTIDKNKVTTLEIPFPMSIYVGLEKQK